MSTKFVKCDCGAVVDAGDVKFLDNVRCHDCSKLVKVTPMSVRAAGDERPSRPRDRKRTPEHSTDFEYDVFISHASEDKDDFARLLADALICRGLKVWLDERELPLGSSIRRGIDRGLARSRYGVVLLSQYYFEKEWAERELGAFYSRTDRRVSILPLLHGITHENLKKISPTLADRVSISTDRGVDWVADKIVTSVKNESPLLPFTMESIGTPISVIQRAILMGPSVHELKRYFYEIDVYLNSHPDSVDARMLHDTIQRALYAEGVFVPERRSSTRQETVRHVTRTFTLVAILGIICGIVISIWGPDRPAPLIVAASPTGDELVLRSTPESEIKLALNWVDKADLDLATCDSSGNRIWYGTPRQSFGVLDRDIQSGPGVETITISRLIEGQLSVTVENFKQSGTPEFVLEVYVDGILTKVYEGQFEDGRHTYSLEIEIAP